MSDDQPITRAEIALALTYLNAAAKRLAHHPDNARWNNLHEQINARLDDYFAAPA